jgi:putative MATE family efflux protein
MSRFDLDSEDITEGSLWTAVATMSAPLVVQNLVYVAQQLIDIAWIGRFDETAVGAVGLVSPVVWFLLSSTIAAAFVGTQVLVSQRVGADDEDGARRAAFAGFAVTVVLGVVVGGVMFLNAGRLVDLVVGIQPGATGSALDGYATVYLEIIALGIVVAGMSDVVEAAFLGWGDSRATLYINLATVVTNLVLDPILIFGYGPVPRLGMEGAGLATVAGYAGGFALGTALVVVRSNDVFTRETMRLRLGEVRELLEIGVPKAVQGASGTSGQLVVVVVVFAAAGTPGLTAYTVGSRVTSVAGRVAMSVSQAVQSVVGQNVGAGSPERARRATRVGAALAGGSLTAVAGIVLVAPESIALLLAPTLTGETLALSTTALLVFALGFPANGLRSAVVAGFDGARRTRTTMVASVAQTWGFQIPAAVVGGIVLGYGALAVFWAGTLSVYVTALLLAGYYVSRANDGMLRRATTDVQSADD